MQNIEDNIYFLVICSMLGVFILVVSFILLLFRSQQKRAIQNARLQEAELSHQKELLRSVIESQEAERIRIGRDLHDDVGSALSNLRLIIERMSDMLSVNDSGSKTTVLCKDIVDRVIAQIRDISHKLSPEIGRLQSLSDAIEELCYIINEGTKPVAQLTNEAQHELDTLDLTTALVIFRVLEELTANTIKHADASNIYIHIKKSSGLLIINYQDDGKGMSPLINNSGGRGLLNIESRLGLVQATFHFSSLPVAGYQMHIEIPY